MDILFPVNRKDFMYSKASAPEILFKISFGGNSLVFLGNASNKIQKFIASTSTMIGKTNILIVSHSALPSNISTLLIDKLKPDYLVYSKLLKNNSAQLDSSTKKKVIVDPLAYITDDKKFNLKELSSVKITFDGIQVIINN